MGPVAEIGLVLGGVLLTVGVVAVALLGARRQRGSDAELVAAVDRCLTTLAERRGLALERFPPLQHPVVGEVPIPPRLHGTIDGFTIELAMESDGSDGDVQTVLRLGARAGAEAWPSVADPCRHASAVPLRARSALERLCSASHRIELAPRTLVAEPKVAAKTDWSGRARRVETDPTRLGAWLDLALNVARSI